MTKRLLLFSVIFFVSVSVFAQEYAITREANTISDSGKVSFQEIPYFYSDRSGKDIVWDFSDNISDKGFYNLWLQKDTLNRNVILSNHDITYLNIDNDTLFIVGKESPLSKITYQQPLIYIHYPFVYGDSISTPFSGYGIYCGDHPFREQGISSVMADATGSLVINEDTISNVLRVYTLKSYSICMDIDSAALDTANLKQVIEERYDWYSRGFRYPIFSSVSCTSYDNLTAVGTEQRTYCMLPDIQKLLSDSCNEVIRANDSIARLMRPENTVDIIHYKISQIGKQLTLEYSLEIKAEINILVCDAMGIVYRRGHQQNEKGNGYELKIDLNGLRNGQYVVYINVNGKVYSSKIKI